MRQSGGRSTREGQPCNNNLYIVKRLVSKPGLKSALLSVVVLSTAVMGG